MLEMVKYRYLTESYVTLYRVVTFDKLRLPVDYYCLYRWGLVYIYVTIMLNVYIIFIFMYYRQNSFKITLVWYKSPYILGNLALRKKCSYSELLWSVFSCIRTRKTPNTDTFYATWDLSWSYEPLLLRI